MCLPNLPITRNGSKQLKNCAVVGYYECKSCRPCKQGHRVIGRVSAEVKGCNFHFGQVLLCKVNDGLRNEYQNNAEFAVWIGLVKSLQLLPPDYVIPVWERLLRYPGPILPLQNGNIHPLILRFMQ